jgi:hypothetical protein
MIISAGSFSHNIMACRPACSIGRKPRLLRCILRLPSIRTRTDASGRCGQAGSTAKCGPASSGLVQIRDPRVVDLAKDAFFPESPAGSDIIAIDGREIDPRMLAQMSRFTLHLYPRPIELLPDSHQWLRRYVIRADAKAKIRAQLSAFGIQRSNIFPDLTNLALELKSAQFG